MCTWRDYVYTSSQDGQAALHAAAKNNHNDVIKELLKCGANCNLQDKVILVITDWLVWPAVTLL